MNRAATAVQEWFSAGELAASGLPGLPATKRGVLNVAEREGWFSAEDDVRGPLSRPRKGRGGGIEFHVTLLPEAARTRLMSARPGKERLDSASMWLRWERLPQSFKDEAQARLQVIDRIDQLQRNGLRKAAAVDEVVRDAAREARAAGAKAPFCCSTVYEWLGRIDGVEQQDRAVYLAPEYSGRTTTSEIPGEAWELYKGDYLRLSKPTHAACYRNLQRVGDTKGWSLPSAKTFQRRMEAEVPADLQTLFRKGQDALDHAFPHLERDRSGILPMQIGNLDGHTWDVRVVWPDGCESRPLSLAVQDIASGKILAIRFDMTLNHHLVRLALADTIRDYGLLDTLIMDNGRENAAAAIAGGQVRNRWGKTPEEEPDGLLKLLGIKAVFATPYWGQAKPIERAFRNFAHDIAKRAEFEGAYTGHNTVSKPENYGSRAIPVAQFEAIIRREIAHYNAQLGRTGIGMNGRSFDQVFTEGLQRRPARRVTQEQLRFCLLASKPVSMDARDHAVRVEGHRYWSPELAALKPQKVIVRFDPEAMDQPAYVYSVDGRLLAEASRIQAGSFDRASDGQAQRRALRDYKRTRKQHAAAVRRLDAADVAAAAAAIEPPVVQIADEKVVALNFNAPRKAEQLGGEKPQDFNTAWDRGVASMLNRG